MELKVVHYKRNNEKLAEWHMRWDPKRGFKPFEERPPYDEFLEDLFYYLQGWCHRINISIADRTKQTKLEDFA
jgi:hypothetical protein